MIKNFLFHLKNSFHSQDIQIFVLNFCLLTRNFKNFCMRRAFIVFPYSTGLLIRTLIQESLAGCRTMFLFAVFCKIGALKRNA